MTDVFNPTTTIETPVVETKAETAAPVVDKRLKDKDDFIEQLKTEMAELRSELKKQVDAETQLGELRNELKSLRERGTTQPRENTTPALTEVDIKTLVQKTITDAEAVKSTAQNIKEANDQLVLTFGGDLAKAGEAVVQRAGELGLSVEFLRDVAAKSPTAFLDVMGKKEAKPAQTFVQGSVNSEALKGSSGAPAKFGTKAYFDNIRKTNQKEYWSPHIQQQIMKAAKDGTYVI